ncbi:hypothetical protein M2138_001077 [Dysgonomonadaceae bacterium PH5-43]|nr:hypothetical protein [Dysgonomonadaceae bacterium PH5-43]
MKRKFTVLATVALLSSSILFSSCIGSFGLFNKLLSWNKSVDSEKWVNELVFFALAAVQVYTIAYAVDALVLNSIEFWTGENPIAEAKVQTVEVEDALYTITTDENGHKIQKEDSDEVIGFIFNKEDNSWSLDAMDQTTPLLKFVGEDHAMVYLNDGSTMTVSVDQAGVYALKQVVENKSYFATK